jgi:hypothetical protein
MIWTLDMDDFSGTIKFNIFTFWKIKKNILNFKVIFVKMEAFLL